MVNKDFDYCSTCGAPEHPICSECNKTFWHREMGANLNAEKGSATPVRLCKTCNSKRPYKKK